MPGFVQGGNDCGGAGGWTWRAYYRIYNSDMIQKQLYIAHGMHALQGVLLVCAIHDKGRVLSVCVLGVGVGCRGNLDYKTF